MTVEEEAVLLWTAGGIRPDLPTTRIAEIRDVLVDRGLLERVSGGVSISAAGRAEVPRIVGLA